jgi:hypothetical protein
MENQKPNEVSIVKQLYRDAFQVLTEPARFFSDRFENMSFNYSLVFGLVITWIAAFFDWITRAVKNETLMDGFLKIKKQLHQLPIWKDLPADIWAQGENVNSLMPAWGLEGLRMLLNPFHSLFTFFTYGIIFWLGATLLVSKDNPAKKSVTITNVIKITSIASATSIVGSILGFLPLSLGSFIGWIYHTALLTIGFSERFQISRLRGLAVVFLPTIVTVLVASCLVAVIVALFAGIISSLFH